MSVFLIKNLPLKVTKKTKLKSYKFANNFKKTSNNIPRTFSKIWGDTMRKFIIGSYCFVLLCVATSLIAIPVINQKATDSNNAQVDTPNISLSYIVKDFNGNVAVFEANASAPFRVTEVSISTLPKADQERLREGIAVADQTELSTLLEDLCS